MKTYPFLFSLLCFYGLNPAFAQDTPEETGVFLFRKFSKGDQTLNYRILYPQDFSEDKKYPLIVFLHGRGERGDDNNAQLLHGSRLFLDSIEKYPAVVIFPQCPLTDYWINASVSEEVGGQRVFNFYTDPEPRPPLGMVMELMDELIEKDYIDDDRVYVSGLSLGGMGTWELLWRIPEKIAAALPICGGGVPAKAPEMVNVPLWIFHGVEDDVVPPHNSILMMNAVQAAGGKAKISLYPDVEHNSWDNAFAEPEFFKWMFSKTRKK